MIPMSQQQSVSHYKQVSNALARADKKSQFKSSTVQGTKFLETVVLDVAEEIDRLRAETEPHKGNGALPAYITAVSSLESPTIALILLTVSLDNLVEPKSVTHVSHQVGDYLLMEINYPFYESRAEGFVKAMSKRWPAKHRHKRAIKYGEKAGIYDGPAENPEDEHLTLTTWSRSQKISIGCVYLGTLVRLGFLEVIKSVSRGVDKYAWTDLVQEWAAQTFEDWLYFCPRRVPLLDKPYGYVSSGYEYSYGSDTAPVSFRLTGGLCKKQDAQLLDNGMTEAAVNKLGQQGYRLNGYVFDVAESLFHSEIPVSTLETVSPIEYPLYPGDDSSEEMITEWKRTVHHLKLLNSRMRGHRLYLRRSMEVIASYRDRVFYFLWQADSRGRLYPLTSIPLSPQGSDFGKSLLLFEESKPVGKAGLEALYLSVAKQWGEDKASLSDRKQWVEDNMTMLSAIHEDPVRQVDLWRHCDSPFMFLAALHELISALNSDDPYAYECSLPVYSDGKCSGIQHYSCLLRDEIAGATVGFTEMSEHDTPTDIYLKALTELSIAVVNQPKSKPQQYWSQSIAEFTRSLTKRPVMTFVYAATVTSIGKHIKEWMSENLPDREVPEGLTKGKLAHWLATLMMKKVLPALAPGPYSVMSWLRECCKEINKVSPSITWVSPSGYQVCQAYVKHRKSTVRITCKVFGLRQQIQFNDVEGSCEVNKKSQVSGIVPNFIHSFDSAHLVSFVNHVGYPVTVIHDDFGSLPGDRQRLYEDLRITLSNMYLACNWLEVTKNRWESLYGIGLPDPPSMGNLDLSPDALNRYLYLFS